MSAQWLTQSEAIEKIRALLGANIGRSEAVLRAARASGEVRFQNPADPVLLMADDGLVGMDMRPGAQSKSGISGDGKAIVHKISRSQNSFQISEDDLLDWLNRSYPESKPKAQRGGRPPAYDWDAIRKAAFELMDHHDEFSVDDPEWNAQARLEEKLCDRFGVGTSALRARLPNILKDWRKLKAAN
jgi:hypothetical protein